MDNNIILKNPVFKLFNDEVEKMLERISETYNIDIEDLKKLSFSNSNLAIQYGIKKRIKRKIDKDKQCMGRKIDGDQCTRSRKDCSDYCLSHQKNLKFGRIDDPNYNTCIVTKKKKKKENDDYIATKRHIIEHITYLIDEDNNIYSYNIDKPIYIGKYDSDTGKIVCSS